MECKICGKDNHDEAVKCECCGNNFYNDKEAAVAEFKKVNMLQLIIFTIFSFGIYYPVWFLRMKDVLESIDSSGGFKVKWMKYTLAVYGLNFILIVVGVLVQIFGEKWVDTDISKLTILLVIYVAAKIVELLTFIGTIFIIILSFKVSKLLIVYAKEYYNIEITFFWLVTFILTVIYLQYKINKIIDSGIKDNCA